MWVLDARKNAEKVTYPVIWEEKKDVSNVIDYNINEEITTNKSATFNANNDTTTGIATVIPWVNAPKLIQTTSIYQNSEWNTLQATAYNSLTLYRPNDNRWYIRTWNFSNVYWTLKISNNAGGTVWSGLVIPMSWWYKIDMVCPSGSSVHAIDVSLRITRWWGWNDITLIDHTWAYNSWTPTETITYNFNAWDALYAYLVMTYTGGGIMTATPTVTLNITKL